MGRLRVSLYIVFISLMVISCEYKSKTELYLERGLDVLNNVKELNLEITYNIFITEIGVVRDQQNKKKSLILKLNCDGSDCSDIKNTKLIIKYFKNKEKVGVQNISPDILSIKEYKYIITEIDYKFNKLTEVEILVLNKVNNNERHKYSVKNLYTNND